MSVSILGLKSPSLVQDLDASNSHVSKLGLNKLKSRLLSSQCNWQSTKYEVPVDPIIFSMCNDYRPMCNTTEKKLDMGSKFSQISCSVPNVHYEMKKPVINIIGGYVGAKSQQNRDNLNYFPIHEILADLLPDILSENSQSAEDFPEFQPEKIFGKKADVKFETQICLQNFTLQMEEKVNLPTKMERKINLSKKCRSKGSAKKSSHCNGTVPNGNLKSPTYASVASTPAMSLKLHQPTTNCNTDSSATNRTLKSNKECRSHKRRKTKRKRKRKLNTANCTSTDSNELAANAESDAHLVIDDEHFPSLCEESTPQEPLTCDIVRDVSSVLTTTVNDFISQCADLGSDYLCSYDEVDSPHSANYSCNPQENKAHPKGSTFVCQNNSIAFIMNGNDELSDTDSDCSCENKDSFHDEVWDSFREDFECFQNFFVLESLYPNRTNSDEDCDCELQDEELCVYINQLENESDLNSGEILSARLKEVNQRWDSAMKDVVLDGKSTKVHFAPDNILVEVHRLERSLEEIQSESWEHYQLDRCHFRNRVKELEPVISPCLDSIHRQKVWDRLCCKTKLLEASTRED